MSTLIVDGDPVPAAVERRAGRLFVTVARPLVPAGAPVLLDGTAYSVLSSRDPFDIKPLQLTPDDRVYPNDDAKRRAEAKAVAAVEAKHAKARAQMGKFCEMELTHGLV